MFVRVEKLLDFTFLNQSFKFRHEWCHSRISNQLFLRTILRIWSQNSFSNWWLTKRTISSSEKLIRHENQVDKKISYKIKLINSVLSWIQNYKLMISQIFWDRERYIFEVLWMLTLCYFIEDMASFWNFFLEIKLLWLFLQMILLIFSVIWYEV